MSEWQPIETAPKDGTSVLTWGCVHDDGGVHMFETPSFQLSRFGETGWVSAALGTHEPTHWMPLPEPPK